MKVRRVVTGHSPEGKAIFASDEAVEPIVLEKLQGNEFHRLWGGDAVSIFPDDGSKPASPRYFPPVGGFRFGMFTVPPASTVSSRAVKLVRSVSRKRPVRSRLMSPAALTTPPVGRSIP